MYFQETLKAAFTYFTIYLSCSDTLDWWIIQGALYVTMPTVICRANESKSFCVSSCLVSSLEFFSLLSFVAEEPKRGLVSIKGPGSCFNLKNDTYCKVANFFNAKNE